MATNYNSNIITDGLVFCLDAGDRKSYSGSGTTWYDRSGNGNNGSILSGVEYANNSFTADAQGEGIEVDFPQVTTWTISFWMKKNSNGVSAARMAGTDPSYDRGEIAASGSTVLINGPNGSWTNAGTSFSNGETAHFTAIFDTSSTEDNVKFFKNGVNTLTASQTGTTESGLPTGYVFFARRDYNTEFLPSTLYQASLYNRILTDAEILQNFNAQRGRFGI